MKLILICWMCWVKENTYIQYKKLLMRQFTFSSVFEIWCVFYINVISQFGLATIHLLSGHLWLVVANWTVQF